jgi:hypothetical protein
MIPANKLASTHSGKNDSRTRSYQCAEASILKLLVFCDLQSLYRATLKQFQFRQAYGD